MIDDELLDALCIVTIGWRTDAQRVASRAARDLISARATEAYKRAEIKHLQERLKELEQAND